MSQEAVDYLLTEIRPTLVAEVVDVALELGSEDAHRADLGHFSVPRDVFAYVDHLGQIAYGGRPTKRSVRFLREFFPPQYDDLADLLYAMWRHGVVHSYEPISYSAPLGDGEVAVYWVSTNHASDAVRKHHLLPYAIEGLDDVAALVVNTCQLACDLRDALDTFIERLRGTATFGKIVSTKLSITSNISTVRRGRSITFSGKISPNMSNGTHVTVYIRKSTSSTWSKLSTRNTYSSHHWSYGYKVSRSHKTGTYYVRVQYAGSTKYLASHSSSRKIVIKK
jgi:hypothetical protein